MGEVKIKMCHHPGGVHRTTTSHLVAEIDHFLENNPLNPSKYGMGHFQRKYLFSYIFCKSIFLILVLRALNSLCYFFSLIFYCEAKLNPQLGWAVWLYFQLIQPTTHPTAPTHPTRESLYSSSSTSKKLSGA